MCNFATIFFVIPLHLYILRYILIYLMLFVVSYPLNIGLMYYPSFDMIRKPKSAEFQFNKMLHIMSIFHNSITKCQIKGEKSFKI